MSEVTKWSKARATNRTSKINHHHSRSLTASLFPRQVWSRHGPRRRMQMPQIQAQQGRQCSRVHLPRISGKPGAGKTHTHARAGCRMRRCSDCQMRARTRALDLGRKILEKKTNLVSFETEHEPRKLTLIFTELDLFETCKLRRFSPKGMLSMIFGFDLTPNVSWKKLMNGIRMKMNERLILCCIQLLLIPTNACTSVWMMTCVVFLSVQLLWICINL